MDKTGKLLLFGTVALSVLFIRRALGATAAPIKATTLERQVMRHSSLIWQVALKHDVEPALIAAIMANESSGIHRGARPVSVRTYTGEQATDYVVGLMQVRVDTAGIYCQIWHRYDLEPDAVNVDCGVKYLRAMLDKFGKVAPAVSAYNAGAGSLVRDVSMVGGMQYANVAYVRSVLVMIGRFRLLFMGTQGAGVYMTRFPGDKWRFEIP